MSISPRCTAMRSSRCDRAPDAPPEEAITVGRAAFRKEGLDEGLVFEEDAARRSLKTKGESPALVIMEPVEDQTNFSLREDQVVRQLQQMRITGSDNHVSAGITISGLSPTLKWNNERWEDCHNSLDIMSTAHRSAV